MKTPVDVLLTAVGYWIAIFAASQVPSYVRNYEFNLIWMTIILPNLMRLIVANIPRLAVDRVFFFTSTVIALILAYLFGKVFRQTKETLTKDDGDRRKMFDMNLLLVSSFVAGALITYYVGIDRSIYSNMGWETTA